jgi:hypothetical protein
MKRLIKGYGREKRLGYAVVGEHGTFCMEMKETYHFRA